MKATGELILTSVKTGTSSKSGKPYFTAKFLDSEAEEFITVFVEEEIFHTLEVLPKNTTVLATISLVLGSKYFSLQSVEPIED